MFEGSLLNFSSPRKSMPLAGLLEFALLGLLILAPLINTRALTFNELRSAWAVFVPTPPPSTPPSQRQVSRFHTTRHVPAPDTLQAPTRIPDATVKYIDEPPPLPQPTIGIPGSVSFGPAARADAVMQDILSRAILPPPPKTTKARQPIRVRRGGDVIAAKAIYQPAPDFPPLAQGAHVQGVVRLEAVIATDGTIQGLRAMSGHPWLVRAAMEAVSRWRYQPTLLNGEPVEVVTEIDVTFKLAD